MHHLEDKNTYQGISCNPTTQVEKQVVAAVKDPRKEEYINDDETVEPTALSTTVIRYAKNT